MKNINYKVKDLEDSRVKLPKKYKVVSDKELKRVLAGIEKRYHKLFEALAKA